MSGPVTTYVLTFKSSVPDEQDRRANLNRFLKAALRRYGLDLVNMHTSQTQAARRAPKPEATRPYGELIEATNKRFSSE